MTRRAEAADATRARIVEATLALHREQGVLATSYRDIARRADVAPATVSRYFPELDDIVVACGQLVVERYPSPTSEIFTGGPAADDPDGLAGRVERLVVAWFAFHSMQPHWHTMLVDRSRLAPLDAYLADVDARHRALCAEALASVGSPAAGTSLLRAVTDHGVWRSLAADGATVEGAAGQVLELLVPWLDGLAGSRGGDRRVAR
jgi:AcrR family transcriptional regulator